MITRIGCTSLHGMHSEISLLHSRYTTLAACPPQTANETGEVRNSYAVRPGLAAARFCLLTTEEPDVPWIRGDMRLRMGICSKKSLPRRLLNQASCGKVGPPRPPKHEVTGNAARRPRGEGVEASVRGATCVRVSTALTPSAGEPVRDVLEGNTPLCGPSGNYRRESSGKGRLSQIQFRQFCKSPVCLMQRTDVNSSRGLLFTRLGEEGHESTRGEN